MDVTVAVATFGAQSWHELALERAIPSARDQAAVVHAHGRTLAEARNAALSEVETEWVIHLDADDELEKGYVEALSQGTADLRAPRVRYVRGSQTARPRFPRVAGHRHDCRAECLEDGNWLVIGTAVRAELVRRVGGWHEWPVYEDWDLFLRCYRAGASVEGVPGAVYRAHVRTDSRNRAPAIEEKNRVHHEIVAANEPVPVAH